MKWFATPKPTYILINVSNARDICFCHEAELAQVEPSFDLENTCPKRRENAACDANPSAYVMSSKL